MLEEKAIALSFRDLSVTSFSPPKSILNNISGYVVKGGMTAGMLKKMNIG